MNQGEALPVQLLLYAGVSCIRTLAGQWRPGRNELSASTCQAALIKVREEKKAACLQELINCMKKKWSQRWPSHNFYDEVYKGIAVNFLLLRQFKSSLLRLIFLMFELIFCADCRLSGKFKAEAGREKFLMMYRMIIGNGTDWITLPASALNFINFDCNHHHIATLKK